MNNINNMDNHDVFISYAHPDAHYAKRLYNLLTAIGYKVFLDTEDIAAGDLWSERIQKALEGSTLMLILVSNRTNSAYFQKEETLKAIEIARRSRSRVIPIFLTNNCESFLLNQIQAIRWKEGTSLLSLALKIEEAALKTSRKYEEWQHKIVSETIVIVTGCNHIAEVFDRPTAYELKASIDDFGRSLARKFLYSVVMSDIWSKEYSDIQRHPNIISIGSPGVNSISGVIVNEGDTIREGKDWKIVQSNNRWALFGDHAEETEDAVSSFKAKDRDGFLGNLWPQEK